MSRRYDILFEGELVPGKTMEAVTEKLAAVMNSDAASVHRLFQRAPVVLRRGVTAETAQRFLGAFDRAGAVCRMVPVDSSDGNIPDPPSQTAAPRNEASSAGEGAPPAVRGATDRSDQNLYFGGGMILTNLENVPGKTVVEHFGLVSGSTIRAKHMGRDIMASLKNLVGGELKGYTQLMQESRQQAVTRMIAQAEQLGANAVINIRFSTSSVAQGAAELYAYGTAVRVE